MCLHKLARGKRDLTKAKNNDGNARSNSEMILNVRDTFVYDIDLNSECKMLYIA